MAFKLFLVLVASIIIVFYRLPSSTESSLSKYTYALVGIRTVSGQKAVYPLGSCFFIRRGKELFLVTAKHNIDGYNTFTLKPTDAYFDTIGVRYYDPQKKQNVYSSLNILSLKKYLPNKYFYENPDAIIMQMNDTIVEPYINSIEKYIYDYGVLHGKGDSLIGFEYGLIDPTKYSHNSKPVTYRGVYTDRQHDDPAYPRNDAAYFTANPVSIQGMSGGPIFFRSNEKIKARPSYRFAGVIFGKDDRFGLAFVVPAAEIERQVREFRSLR